MRPFGRPISAGLITAGLALMSLFTLATDAAAQTYTLTVQSTPATGIVIISTSGDGGTTNYTVAGIANFTTVQLSAPATDPTGYTFSRWTVNDTAQPLGLKPLTVTITVDTTAVAQYTLNGSTLVVQSTPPTGLGIGSGTGDAGMTNYTVANVAAGTNVNLQAPTPDPAGYTFAQWAVNGVAQAAGVKSVTFPAPAGFLQWGNFGTGDGQFIVPSAIALDNLGNVYVADQYNFRVEKFTSAGAYIAKWGTQGTGTGQFEGPFAIAVDADNNVYVADAFNNNIQKFTSDGGYITHWGSAGSGNGQFNVPDGIAVDSLGFVYVADSNNFRVQKFTSSGGYVSQWGSQGSGNGQFEYSYGIAIDNLDNVYVADESNFRIQKFTTAGAYVAQWGTLEFPAGIAVDDFGNVYVADLGSDCVQEFNSAGTQLNQWGSPGAAPGQFDDPYAVAVDGPGNVIYVADAANNRVEVLAQNILAVAQYTTGTSTYTLTVQSTPPTGLSVGSGTGDGGMTNYSVTGIVLGQSVDLQAPATDPAGYTFSQWTLNGASLGVGLKSVTFAAPASFFSWGSEGTGNSDFDDPTGVAVASNGNVYVVDSENDRIQEFTSSGTYVTQWGGSGGGNGLFSSPTGIALDGAGNVYVADTGNQLIQVFTSAGVFQTQWGSKGSGTGEFEAPTGIAIDTAGTGNVYVVDSENDSVLEFTSEGGYVTQWTSFDSGTEQFTYPTGITIDNLGNVYVADTLNNRIEEFNSDGGYETQWGSEGAGNGQFELPGGIAADSAGNVYVADTGNGRIQEFTSAGAYLTQWGSAGAGAGQFEDPGGVALNSAGNIYVADTDNERIQEIFGQNILAVAQYTTGTGIYTLAVQSTPPTGLTIGSNNPGQGAVTNYTITGITNGTSVNLQAPAADASGLYTFSQWTLNGVAQPPGTPPTSITFTMTADATAVAQYGPAGRRVLPNLTVQSTPVTGLSIGSGSGDGGTTNYTVTGITNGSSVNLQAPATDVNGDPFSQWTLNSVAQPPGTPPTSITFTMTADTTAVAQYGYTLTVESTPPTGLSIGSGTGDGAATNYAVPSISPGASVNLQAPETDPAGYTFLDWTVQGPGLPNQLVFDKSISFAMPATAVTAEAVYTTNKYTLQVEELSKLPNDTFLTYKGMVVSSSPPQYGGTAPYTVNNIAYQTPVNLVAQHINPTGLTFAYWLVNGVPQPTGQADITFPMPAAPSPGEAIIAAAVYTPNNYPLTVTSTPPTGLSIGSTSGDGEMTDYTVSSVAYGSPVNLVAPTPDPVGYTFEVLDSEHRIAGFRCEVHHVPDARAGCDS